MNKLIVMEKLECQFYLTENCIKTIKGCVCGKIHRFYYKTEEFDRTNFTNPVSIFRFCSNKPLELVIIKQNKDAKTKLDWTDADAVKEYKKQQKRLSDEKRKGLTPPNSPVIHVQAPVQTPVQTPVIHVQTPEQHKKKIVLIKKK